MLVLMLVPAGVALLISAIAIPLLASWARARNLLDIPNARSSHMVPTPRVGGIGIVLGVSAGFLIATAAGDPLPAAFLIVAAGASAIVAVSAADDFRPVPALPRLAIQSTAALAVAMLVLEDGSHIGLLRACTVVLVAVWIVGLVNAYNFMDGIDGIAGGQAVVAAVGWGIAGVLMGAPPVTLSALLIGAAATGFLFFNWPPARVFMGDTGSAFLGYAFAAMPLLAPIPLSHALSAGALFLWPFLLDTTLTFLARLRRGENVVTAHRSHFYQQLTARGMSHQQVTLLYTGLALLGLPGGLMAVAGSLVPATVYGGLLLVAAVIARRRI